MNLLTEEFATRYDRQTINNNGGAVVHIVRNVDESIIVIKTDDGDLLAEFDGLEPENVDEVAAQVVNTLQSLRFASRLKTTKLVECGSCGCYHATSLHGDYRDDCRFDGNRFPTPNDYRDEAENWDEEEDEY